MSDTVQLSESSIHVLRFLKKKLNELNSSTIHTSNLLNELVNASAAELHLNFEDWTFNIEKESFVRKHQENKDG